MRTSNNDIRRGNMDTNQPSKEQASIRTNKYGKKCPQHHIPAQKNKHLGKTKDKCYRRDWTSEKTKVDPGRTRDHLWISRITTWKPYEWKRPRGRERTRDELDDYWKGTIWHRIAQDRHTWKPHTEAFAQPRDNGTAGQRDTLAAQWRWWIRFCNLL